MAPMAVFIVANGVRTVCRHGWMVRHRVLRSVGWGIEKTLPGSVLR